MRYGDNCSRRRAEPYPPSEISPYIHPARSVAVLDNVETTPVQLHTTPFQNRDATGARNSSYLLVNHQASRSPRASNMAVYASTEGR